MKRADQVSAFWREVWNEGRTDLIDTFMADDFVIHSGGQDIASRDKFRAWVEAFQSKIADLHFQIHEIFEAGDRVVTRWQITGRNHGFMQTPDNGRTIDLTGITISVVRDDGLITEKWVERSAWELYNNLSDD